MTIGLDGVPVPDAAGIWEDSSIAFDRDWTWELTDSSGDTEQLTTLVFPRPDLGSPWSWSALIDGDAHA
jgi:hypothetical protein